MHNSPNEHYSAAHELTQNLLTEITNTDACSQTINMDTSIAQV